MKNKFIFILVIFLFSFMLRLWGLNDMGRAWDESPYVDQGYELIELAKNGDFANAMWYNGFDHPPFARYIYGLAEHLDSVQTVNNGRIFPYDYTYPRIVSAFFSSLSVVFVALIGWEYISPQIGIYSATIFSMVPFFIGFAKTATLESFIMLFFTSTVYFYLRLLDKFTIMKSVATGVFLGIALLVKQTNLLLIPLLLIIQVFWFEFDFKKIIQQLKQIFSSWIIVIFSTFVTVFLLWPMPWFHIEEVIKFHNTMWVENVKLPPPEVFFGKLLLVPTYYYIVMFFITTPFLLLVLSFFGLLEIQKKKKKILYIIFIWFLFPFIQSFYPFRQHGIRYIIEIYAPFSIIAGLGLEYLSRRFSLNLYKRLLLFISIIIYLAIHITIIHPYYLNYYNETVGGAKGVYNSRMFQLGWWLEGKKEAALFVDNHAKNKSIVAFHPNLLPENIKLKNITIVPYREGVKYDYVVLNYFNILREGFDASSVYAGYTRIYSVMAGGARLVDVYQRKK